MVSWLLVVAAPIHCTRIKHWQAARRVQIGNTLLEADDLEAALVEFQQAAALDPQLAVAHSRMGVIYRRMGEYDQAVACFAGALRRDPRSFDDTLNLAQLYHFMHRLKDAVQAYLHAVDLRPLDFDAQLNLGVCYQQLGDYSQAVERFHAAVDIDPDRPHAYVNLGVAYDAQHKYYQAINAYKAALERDSRQPLVLVNLAHTYMNQDRLKIAREVLRQAVVIDRNLAAGYEALGYCLFRMTDYEEAEWNYKAALGCDPRLPRAHAGLGSIYMLRWLADRSAGAAAASGNATATDGSAARQGDTAALRHTALASNTSPERHASADTAPTTTAARSAGTTSTRRRSRHELRALALEHWHLSLELDPNQPRIRRLIAKYKRVPTDPEATLLDGRPPR